MKWINENNKSHTVVMSVSRKSKMFFFFFFFLKATVSFILNIHHTYYVRIFGMLHIVYSWITFLFVYKIFPHLLRLLGICVKMHRKIIGRFFSIFKTVWMIEPWFIVVSLGIYKNKKKYRSAHYIWECGKVKNHRNY